MLCETVATFTFMCIPSHSIYPAQSSYQLYLRSLKHSCSQILHFHDPHVSMWYRQKHLQESSNACPVIPVHGTYQVSPSLHEIIAWRCLSCDEVHDW